ncbi:unnamed protein product [Sphagnum tenellum]
MEYLCLSPGRLYCRQERQEVSSESFGEVRAAIPFNWEEAPGRPKLQQHISSLVNKKRIIREGATGFDDVELGDKQLNPPIVHPTTRLLQQRPWTTQFSPAELDFSTRPWTTQFSPAERDFSTRRFQAGQMLATSVGNITEDVIIRSKIPAKVTPSTGSAFLYSSSQFQAERRHKSEQFVIGQKLPLPPRLRADQMLATSVGNITEDVITKSKIPAKVTPSTGSAFLYSSSQFQAERRHKSEQFVIGQRLPLPPRLRALKNQVAPDSCGTGIQQFQTILGVENQLPDSGHDGSGHRRALSLSNWIAELEASLEEEDDDDEEEDEEDEEEEEEEEDEEEEEEEEEEDEEEEEEEGFSFRYMHGRSKDTRPTFLRNKMQQRWRKLDLQGHLSDEFVCNKVVDHSSTENTKRISLEFSGPQHSHNHGFSKERLLEKQNTLDDVPKAAASSGAVSSGCSFRNLAAALLARKSKSSSRTASSRSSPAAISPHDFHVPSDLSAREEETTVPYKCRQCRHGRHKARRLTSCFAIASPSQSCNNLDGLTPGYESP